MDRGMIFVPLVGRSAAFVAYWTPRSFVSSKTMPLKSNLHGFQQKSNSFSVPSPPALIQVGFKHRCLAKCPFVTLCSP